MKRSEAVTQLSLELRDIVMENYIDQKGDEWCANLLLTRMEELGMLPPYTMPADIDEENLMMGYKGINEWEPEDV